MKNNRYRSSLRIFSWMLPVLLFAVILALSLATAPSAQAAPPVAPIELSSTLMPDGSLFLAQIAPAPSATVATTFTAVPPVTVIAPAATPWYTNEAMWSTLFAVAAGIFGIVRNTQLSTHQKINEALVLGIEQATKIPEVAAFENKIKATIQSSAEGYGVQPLLHRIVQDLTEPAATANGSTV